MKNQEIAKILFEMAEVFQMQNIPFTPRAFEKEGLIKQAIPRNRRPSAHSAPLSELQVSRIRR